LACLPNPLCVGDTKGDSHNRDLICNRSAIHFTVITVSAVRRAKAIFTAFPLAHRSVMLTAAAT
jgi:hypothetical protein